MKTSFFYKIARVVALVVLVFIILGVIQLSFQRYTTYQVYFQEAVTGLATDAIVEYNGVNVGKVKSIQLNPKNPRIVEVLLGIKKGTLITHGTVAILTVGGLSNRGVTGFVYIALKDEGTDLRPLLAQAGQRYPVIPTAPATYKGLNDAFSRITTSMQQMNSVMQSVFNKENIESLKEVLYSLQQVANNLSSNSEKLNKIIANTAKASDQFEPFLTSTKNTMIMLQTQTLPMIYRTFTDFDNLSHTFSSVANEIKQNPAVLFRGAVPILGPGEVINPEVSSPYTAPEQGK